MATGKRPCDLLSFDGSDNERLLLDIAIIAQAQETSNSSSTKSQIDRRMANMEAPRLKPRFK